MEPIPCGRWEITAGFIPFSVHLTFKQLELSLLSQWSMRKCGRWSHSRVESCGWPINVSHYRKIFKTISFLAWWNPSSTPTTIVAADIKREALIYCRDLNFNRISSILATSLFTHDAKFPDHRRKLGDINPLVVLYSHSSAALSIIPGQNPLWPDLVNTINQAQAWNLTPRSSLSNFSSVVWSVVGILSPW